MERQQDRRQHDEVKALRPRQACQRTAQRYARLNATSLVLCWCYLADPSAGWLGTLAVNLKPGLENRAV